MNTYVLLKFLGHLALPPASLMMGLVVGGILMLVGWRRFGRIVCYLAIGQTVLLSFPPVAELLMGRLESVARAEAAKAKPCCYDAILVLGGSIAPADPPEYPDPALTDSSDRLWQAARLYRKGVAPKIIVSGGTFIVDPASHITPEADAMKIFLVELGVPPDAILKEGEALNTLQNIAYVRNIVGTKSVALVTSGFHMPRAMRAARLGDLDAAAFPTDWRVPLTMLPSWQRWLPTPDAQNDSSLALWEIMALLFDFRGPPQTP